MKKYFLEFFGTLILTLVVIASIFTTSGLPTPILAGLTVAIFVYTIGAISGAHLNPGVTIGVWSIKKIGTKDAFIYILVQILGGLAAFGISRALGYHLPVLIEHFSMFNLFAEVIGMIVFTFGIAHVIFSHEENKNSAFIIGASLMIGGTLGTGLGSYGILNPAISIGVHIFDISYLVGPIIGAVLGMWLYKWIRMSK